MGPVFFLALIIFVVPVAIAAGMNEDAHGNRGSDNHGKMSMSHMDDSEGGGHAHGTWINPPDAYRGMRSPTWGDPRAIENGRRLYQ